MITKALMRARAAQYRKFAAETENPMLHSALIELALAYENLAARLEALEPAD